MEKINFEKRMRLKFNLYASRTAYQRLKKAIEDNNDHEIYAATGELLLWTINIDHWHLNNGNADYDNKRNNTSSGRIIKGLAYAYNSVKHNMDIFTIHNKVGGFKFPIEFPIEIPKITVSWIIAGALLDPKYENQRKNYINYVQEKELIPTFSDALTFLNKESQVILFKENS